MLTVHRKGKRHLEGLKAFYCKKAQLKNEITKRQHETYVQAEDKRQEPSSSAPLLAQTRKLTHHALLKTVPYNSCHRKTSTKSEKGPVSISSDPSGNAYSKTPPEQHSACWKSEVSNSVPPGSSSGFITGKACHRKSFFLLFSDLVLKKTQAQSCFNCGDVFCFVANKELHQSKDMKGSQLTGAQQAEPMTAQRRRELEHYLKLKSDGWLQDRSGQWIKDESVEFDSDEEEPPSLARLPTSV
ncbi:sodium channel modifier 1 isoform X3 [Toxotes jaculatrix]|nr:sodium channel modifier 1 isoform X3 [Toxotes jaculatrix]